MDSNHFDGIVIRGGTVVASATFPIDGFVLDFSYTSQVLLEDLIIDNQHRGGGMRFDTTLQTTLDNVFFLHYSSWGVLGDDAKGMGHELTIQNSYFAEFMWGEPGYNVTAQQNGTAIEMRFPDSNFLQNIIRCTRVGVWDRSGSNSWMTMHIYATCNKDPTGANVAVGFVADGNQARISHCYFDDSPVVIRYFWQMRLTDSIFYGLSGLVFAPPYAGVAPSGTVVARNMFTSTSYANPYINVDTSGGSVNTSAMVNMNVMENTFSDLSNQRSTQPSVTVTLSGTGAAPTCADVNATSLLVFGVPYPSLTFDWRALLRLAASEVQAAPMSAPLRTPALSSIIARWTGAASIVASTGFAAAVPMPMLTVAPTADAAVVSACVAVPGAPAAATWIAGAYVTLDQSGAAAVF